MPDDNSRNLLYFESHFMRGLFEEMESWQIANQKRLLSLSIQPDGSRFCCIALTNPSEVMITGWDGRHARVSDAGELIVWNNGA